VVEGVPEGMQAHFGKCVYGNVSRVRKARSAADARSPSAPRRGEHAVRIHPDRS